MALAAGLAVISLYLIDSVDGRLFLNSSLSQLELFLVPLTGYAANTYAHERLHYEAFEFQGLDALYIRPTAVAALYQDVEEREAVISLLAPQLISPLYIALIFIISNPVLIAVLSWALLLNVVGATDDLLWTGHRLRWPEGTVMLTTLEPTNYVAFPESAE